MSGQLDLKDPLEREPITITRGKKADIEVVGHQREPRPAHLKALTVSMERMGFITLLVTVRRDGKTADFDKTFARFIAPSKSWPTIRPLRS
jgi:hypothetical protein